MTVDRLYTNGMRVEMVRMPDDPDAIAPGTCGTVTGGRVVDFIGPHVYEQVHVQWDNGRTLSACVPPDTLRVLP